MGSEKVGESGIKKLFVLEAFGEGRLAQTRRRHSSPDAGAPDAGTSEFRVIEPRRSVRQNNGSAQFVYRFVNSTSQPVTVTYHWIASRTSNEQVLTCGQGPLNAQRTRGQVQFNHLGDSLVVGAGQTVNLTITATGLTPFECPYYSGIFSYFYAGSSVTGLSTSERVLRVDQ